MKQLTLFISAIFILFLCCNATDSNQTNNIKTPQTTNYKLLSLGDSYTIGESVCKTCRFPEQLKDSLINNIENTAFNLKVVATTGWTTTNLLNGIINENLPNNYDLVTLLIGVNNQCNNILLQLFRSKHLALSPHPPPLQHHLRSPRSPNNRYPGSPHPVVSNRLQTRLFPRRLHLRLLHQRTLHERRRSRLLNHMFRVGLAGQDGALRQARDSGQSGRDARRACIAGE